MTEDTTPYIAPHIPTDKPLTFDVWTQLGLQLFGGDISDWRFVCPACGRVQTAREFEPYHDVGAKIDSVMHCCLGHFAVKLDATLSATGVCTYSDSGPDNFNPVLVTNLENVDVRIFAFFINPKETPSHD